MQEKKKYQVETVTYIKVPTGEKYPEDYSDKRLRGKTMYNSTKNSSKVLNTTWGKVKQEAYKQSQKDKSVYVGWKRHIEKIVRTHPDGVQEVTYFHPVSGV